MSDYWLKSRGQTDTDAAAVISACSLSAGAQQNACYFLIGALKYYSLWSKMTALYGFVGGSAASHAVNWKTPGVYNITWSGTVTHNSNGITGDGSTGYGDTGINALSVLSTNSAHLSLYSRTNSAIAAYDMGCGAYPSPQQFTMYLKYTTNACATGISCAESISKSNVTDSQGLTIGSRTGASAVALYKRGVPLVKATTASIAMPNYNVMICARRQGTGGVSDFSNRNLSFCSIGFGLSDTDAINLSSIVQSFQTILGRAV